MGSGPLIAAAALAPLVRLKPGFDYWTELLPPLIVFSVGLSLTVAPLTATVLADADESDAGIASGVNNAVARVAGLLGIAVVGASVAGSGQHARPVRVPARHVDHGRADLRGRAHRVRGDSECQQAAEIVFDHVTKRYAGRDAAAVDDLSLEIPAGSFCVLVGPSGGGKTTALKMVNRLIPFDSGEIRIDGRSIEELPLTELRRGIGYVIQQIGLFPHMTIGENIATVPRLLGWDEAAAARSASVELLELVGLDAARREALPVAALRRPAPARRARARARGRPAAPADGRAVRRARPDHARTGCRRSCAACTARSAKTIIFVTHDIDEAIQMGDRIAILREGGVLAQYDTPDAILAHPADDFVAQFIGEDRALRRLALRTRRRASSCDPRRRAVRGSCGRRRDTTVRNARLADARAEDRRASRSKDGDRASACFRLARRRASSS